MTIRDELRRQAEKTSHAKAVNYSITNTKTLRDEFAMAALTGLVANPDFSEQDFEAITSAAYVAADNMLAQRMPYG